MSHLFWYDIIYYPFVLIRKIQAQERESEFQNCKGENKHCQKWRRLFFSYQKYRNPTVSKFWLALQPIFEPSRLTLGCQSYQSPSCAISFNSRWPKQNSVFVHCVVLVGNATNWLHVIIQLHKSTQISCLGNVYWN